MFIFPETIRFIKTMEKLLFWRTSYPTISNANPNKWMLDKQTVQKQTIPKPTWNVNMLKQIRERVAWVAKDPFLKDKKEEKGQKVVWEKLL